MKNVKQNLELLYDYVMKLEEKYKFLPTFEFRTQEISYEDKQLEDSIKKDVLAKTISLFEYDKLPKIVSDDIYEKMNSINFKNQGVKVFNSELFRGVRNINHHANTLFDKKYHIGLGDVCNGLYATQNFQTAFVYTNCTSEDLVLCMKIPDMRIIDNLTLVCDVQNAFSNNKPTTDENVAILNEIVDFVNLIEDPIKRSKFLYAFLSDLSIVAIFLGYDAVFDTNFPSYAIFNRGKICVSKSQSDKIKRLANFCQEQEPIQKQ